jgi:hypothetical protein
MGAALETEIAKNSTLSLSLSPLSLFTIVALPPVVLAEKYREIHLRNNPDYPQVSALSVYCRCVQNRTLDGDAWIL